MKEGMESLAFKRRGKFMRVDREKGKERQAYKKGG